MWICFVAMQPGCCRSGTSLRCPGLLLIVKLWVQDHPFTVTLAGNNWPCAWRGHHVTSHYKRAGLPAIPIQVYLIMCSSAIHNFSLHIVLSHRCTASCKYSGTTTLDSLLGLCVSQVYRILCKHSAAVQPLSCDEAMVDVTGLGDPTDIAAAIRQEVSWMHTKFGPPVVQPSCWAGMHGVNQNRRCMVSTINPRLCVRLINSFPGAEPFADWEVTGSCFSLGFVCPIKGELSTV